MCLYPKKIYNKKYTPNKKNGGKVPEAPIIGTIDVQGIEVPIHDTRVLQIEVPCGNCEECRKGKARQWQIRLGEEIKEWKYKYFITLTFSPKELEELCKKTRLKECNAVMGYAVRHMLERYRKDKKTSLKHWIITELGHENTERIHGHGLLMSNDPLEFIKSNKENFYTWKYWKYGLVYVGQYVNMQTINYIVKYINKIDTDHKGFVGEILCSPGIGKSYIDKLNNTGYYYRPHKTIDYYTLPNGTKVKQPKYYKNKLFNENEREMIWRDFMDLEKQTIAGNTYDLEKISKESLENITEKARRINKEMGYGDDSKEWRKQEWNVTRRMLQQIERDKRKAEMEAALAAKMAEKDLEE